MVVYSDDLAAYKSADFNRLAVDLDKTAAHTLSRAKSAISKLKGNGMGPQDERGVQQDIKAVETARARFHKVHAALRSGKPIKVKAIEGAYDDYAYSVGMLEANVDRWDTVIASGVVKKAIATIAIFFIIRKKIEAAGASIEKELAALKKALKKAEKAKTGVYIKTGLSLALDVVKFVSPQARAMSKISDLAVGGLIDVGSNILVGKPSDFVGSTLGLGVTAAEIEYDARELTKGADALAKAGKAMKYDGLIGAVGDIKAARKEVDAIKARIEQTRAMLVTRANFLAKTAKDVSKAEAEIANLLRRTQANAAKAGNARKIYQDFKSAREGI